MKNLLLVLFAMSLFSCNTEQKTDDTQNENSVKATSENALLYTDVSIKQEVNFFPEMNPDWKESLVKSNLLHKLIEGALNGKEVYDYDGLPMPADDVKMYLGQSIDTLYIEDLETMEMDVKITVNEFDEKEVIGLFFKESWSMDNDLTSFEKTIYEFSVVRQFKTDSIFEKSRIAKSLAFKIYNSNDVKNFKTIAENVLTEFYFEQEQAGFVTGLNTENFSKAILNYVAGGNKIYSFNDINQELNLDDLKEQLGVVTDTINIEDLETGKIIQKAVQNFAERDNVVGVIFIEDWQFDEETMVINKKVVGIAPIWHKMEISDTGDVMETNALPFVIKFKN